MKIVCLMGPTASGKTHLAIELVKRLPFTIISVDSGMIYRGMDIGTAKPTAEELAIAPHYLINICDPKETYSAARFRSDALLAIEEIIASGRTPLLVGGTMLYFRTLLQGISTLPSADPIIRARLKEEAAIYGTRALHERLKKIDPKSAARISANDLQRLERALEIYELTGKTPTEAYAENKIEPLPYKNLSIAITPKNGLAERIEKRFDSMLENGLIEEVKRLFDRGDLNAESTAIRTVGYRQVWQYLQGEIDFATMRTRAIIATRQLAKRQMTWLRNWPDLNWL